jgi:transcriptional regulator with XRE-family HTH domain
MEQRPIDLRGFRLANNITQGELADYLGVTRGFISSIENGRANLPDKKLEYLYTMSKKERSWDTDRLMPDSTRLLELSESVWNKQRPKSQETYEQRPGSKYVIVDCDTLLDGLSSETANPNKEERMKKFPDDYLGISRETYDKIIKGKSPLTPTIIEQITQKLPNLNRKWLITGEGDIFLKENPNNRNNDDIHQELQALRSEVKELKEALQQLTKMIH